MSRIGFRYAIDRSFIDILKELHFLSDSGMPTKRYMDFHRLTDARDILLDGIHEAYSKLFDLHPDAANLSERQVGDALKQLYEGKKTDMMISGIANTFLALCCFAETLDAVAAAVRQTRNAVEPASQQNASPPEPTPPTAAVATAQEAVAPQQPDATTASEAAPLQLVLESERDAASAAAAPEPMSTPLEEEAAGDTAEPAYAIAEPVAIQARAEPKLPVLELETPLVMAEAEAPALDAPTPAGLRFEPTATEEPAAPVPGSETPFVIQVAKSPPPPPATPEPLVLELESEAGDDTADAAHASFDAAAPLHLVLEPEMDGSGLEAAPAAAPEPMSPDLEEELAGDTADAAPAMPEPVAAQAAPEPELPVQELEMPPVPEESEAPAPDAAETPTPIGELLTPVFDSTAPETLVQEAPAPSRNADGTSALAQDSVQDAALASPTGPQQVDASPPDAVQATSQDDVATAAPQEERTVIPASLIFDLDALPLKETPPETTAAPPPDVAPTAAQTAPHCTGESVAKSMRCPIQIVLPESTDAAVYDAIFTSLKRHLFMPGE